MLSIARLNTSFVQVFDNALTDDVCSQLILAFEAAPKTHVAIEGVRNYHEAPCKEVMENAPAVIQHAASRYLVEYQKRCGIHPGDWPAEVGFEKSRMRRYDEHTGFYGRHVDVGDHSSARRLLAYFFYLSDVTEGGETVFYGPNDEEEMKIKPKRGTLVMFPPLWTLPHAGKTPISGPKYMIGSYLHYR